LTASILTEAVTTFEPAKEGAVFANIVEVFVDESVDPERKGLHEVVIPRVRQLPGVVTGHWLVPIEGKGISVVVFETEEAARGAIEAMGLKEGASPAPGVSVKSVQTREVIGHL
jgi:hypothetical protein